MTVDEAIDNLFDDWSLFTIDGGLSEQRYWSAPRWLLEQYRGAMLRRHNAIEARLAEERAQHG